MTFKTGQELESHYVMATFARKPLCLVRGDGMYLFDDEGKQYLDFLSGIGVVSLGHCHPAVVAAISAQAEKLIHVGNYFYIENRGEVAQMVSELLAQGGQGAESAVVSDPTWKSFFANSGAEANECAIKLARLYAKNTGRQAHNVVTLKSSFHGRTLVTLAATAQPVKQEVFQPLPSGFIHTPINDIEALESLFSQAADSICAIMVECIQGESGVHPCTSEFLQAAERLAHESGALLIGDEIQSGIFRCGTPFAYQHFGIQPDIVTIAKGVASGFPMGMCSARASVANTFEPGDHGSTFGGSNLAIASAKATLELLSVPAFGKHVEDVGVYLREKLSELPFVEEVRGFGLMCGFDLKEGYSASALVDNARQAGLIVNATGSQTVRLLPPLVCEKAHVDEAVAIIRLSP